MLRETPRERLARRLRDAGHDVDAHRISYPRGWYRINQRFDDTIVTWEVFTGDVWLWSYDTITVCARRGVTLGDRDLQHVQVFANELRKK
jgi:hypothetical protein